MAGFFQATSTVLTAFVCYTVIISSKNILDLAKDFTALMFIIEIDNFFAATSHDSIAKEIIEKQGTNRKLKNKPIMVKVDDLDLYTGLFRVETTTSKNALNSGNVPLEEKDDEANRLVNERIEFYNGFPKKQAWCIPQWCSRKDAVVRPKRISISQKKRCRQFGKVNSILFLIYRFLRILFVSLWFYYLPVVFIVLSNLAPVYYYWGRINGCDKFVS
jgi:hypothetical protein